MRQYDNCSWAAAFFLHWLHQFKPKQFIQQKIHARDLELDVQDAYMQALLTYKQMKSKEQQLILQSQQYALKNRLWDAGKISRIELGEQAITLKNTDIELQELRQTLGDNIRW